MNKKTSEDTKRYKRFSQKRQNQKLKKTVEKKKFNIFNPLVGENSKELDIGSKCARN
jgi:hypothetical protein